MAERPSASGQKEVGRGCCAEARGLLATPGDLTSRPEEFAKEVERHGSALGSCLEAVSCIFFLMSIQQNSKLFSPMLSSLHC